MANQEHLKLLRKGVKAWNRWREKYSEIQPDLSEADLGEAYLPEIDFHHTNLNRANLCKAILSNANLAHADLRKADLSNAIFVGTNLRKADLSEAILYLANLDEADFTAAFLNDATLNEANLSEANFREAKLRGAKLSYTDLTYTNFTQADLSNADLEMARLVKTDFTEADLTNCSVYGTSVWDVQLRGATQLNLVITEFEQAVITVDNLKVAQFIYLLLSNPDIRDVIDTVTSKVVLILGRFTSERKTVLETLREELRKHNYSPVLFDFEKPVSRDLTETVSILAHLARFIIVDLTDPSSAPHEVATVIPHTVVPVKPLLLQESLMVGGKVVDRHEYAMFEDLRRRYHWVLPTLRYQSTAELMASLKTQIIEPAEQKVRELTQPK